MNGKIIKSAFKNEWTSPQGAVVCYHDIEVENEQEILVGSIGAKEKNPAFLAVGQELEFTYDEAKKKFTKSQSQGTGSPYRGGGASAGFKPNEAQWISMQRSIAAQSAAHTAFEYAKGNEKVNSDMAIVLAGKIFDFVMKNSDLK